MRYILTAILLIIPALAMAQTDCRVVELKDRLEVVCVGDEKPVPESAVPIALQPAEKLANSPQENSSSSTPALQAKNTTATETPQRVSNITPAAASPQRQGRQQFQKGMEEARASRSQIISDMKR